MEILPELVLFVALGSVAGIIAIKLKTPLIIGYILAGAILALFQKFTEEDLHFINQFAEMGIALLLFTIGLEFSLEKLLNVKKYAVYGGILQIVLTIIFSKLIFPLFGFSGYESLFLGSVFSLSSTAVVIKVLEDIGQIETHASQITIGWLILQDIAVVMLILLLGNFASQNIDYVGLFESLLKSFLLIAMALLIGNKIIPRILKSIANLGSKELLIVVAFGFCFSFALLAEEMVGSYTLGAFLSGMMISESFLHHEIFNEIKPLQNIFTAFFFIVIGTLFSFGFVWTHGFQIILILIIVTLIKLVIVISISLLLKMHIRNAIEVAVNLAQVGEFAFLSATIGLDNNWISSDLNSLIISVTVLSLLISPLMITRVDAIYEKIRDYFHKKYPSIYRKYFMAREEGIVLGKKNKNHIIICGYGRVGKYIALALRRMRFKFLIIDLDSKAIGEAKHMNMNTIYGDATSEELLLQAGIEDARAIVIALDKEGEVVSVAEKVKAINPDLKMIIRSHHDTLEGSLKDKYDIIEPEFEAALQVMVNILPFLGKRDKKIIRWLRDNHQELI